MVVLAAKNWPTNGHLIADVAKLYLRKDHRILDVTFGLGVWWSMWQPDHLVASDIKPGLGAGYGAVPLDDTIDFHPGVDFRNLPFVDSEFDVVAFDPPYKLNGTDQGEGARYGVHIPQEWRAKMQMIREGITECARVVRKGGKVLMKCQDQVCSGKVRFQTIDFTNHAHAVGLDLIDRFDYYGGYRAQPDGRRQVHARGRGSTLLIFERVS
jgi:ubiquinone/menaquinone biosynthesis C-methylase UbiE